MDRYYGRGKHPSVPLAIVYHDVLVAPYPARYIRARYVKDHGAFPAIYHKDGLSAVI